MRATETNSRIGKEDQMAARGRKPFMMSDEHRVKIQNSNILSCLLKHVEGKQEMSATQVTAGIALLKKVMPDISSIEISGPDDAPIEVIHKIELIGKNASQD